MLGIKLTVSGDSTSTLNSYAYQPIGSTELDKVDGTMPVIERMIGISAPLTVPTSTPGQKRRATIELFIYGNGTIQVPIFGIRDRALI